MNADLEHLSSMGRTVLEDLSGYLNSPIGRSRLSHAADRAETLATIQTIILERAVAYAELETKYRDQRIERTIAANRNGRPVVGPRSPDNTPCRHRSVSDGGVCRECGTSLTLDR